MFLLYSILLCYVANVEHVATDCGLALCMMYGVFNNTLVISLEPMRETYSFHPLVI